MLAKIYNWFHRITSKPEERDEYSSGHWQESVRAEALALSQNLKGRVLDLGCGEGLFLIPLAVRNKNIEIYGIDNNSGRLSEAEKKTKAAAFNNTHLQLHNATEIPFGDSYFDAVICINTFFNMESIDAVKKTLSEMKRACKVGGKIIFDFRNSSNKMLVMKYRLARYYDETVKNLPLNAFSPEEIELILKDLNFKVTERRFIPHLFGKVGWLRKIAPIIVIEAERC